MYPRTREFSLCNNLDVVHIRQYAREMARELGFGPTDQTRIATAVSEVTRHTICSHYRGGVRFAVVTDGSRRGLECLCRGSEGPEHPLSPTEEGLPPGLERLVDELVWGEDEGMGITIILRKWLRPAM